MVHKVTFNNGYECPIIGLGTARAEGDEIYEAVKYAIDVGYRHIDCAHLYRNEQDIGRAVRDMIMDGTVTRSELFITGKLWNSFHRKDMVKPAMERSLNDLGLDYLDLYLIHWPMAFKDGWDLNLRNEEGRVPYSEAEFTDTWNAMESLVDEGFVRSIGVSNFNKEQIEKILAVADIKPVTNQVECHPYLNQSKLLRYCETKGITLTAYRAIGLADDITTPVHDPIIKKLACKHNKSLAQILIRFQLQRGIIVISKSTNQDRIKSNRSVFDFELDSDDMKAIAQLNKDKMGRQLDVPYARDHRNYPFHAEY